MKTKEEINKIFSIFEKNNRNPKTELSYNSSFELLIKVILSAKSKDKVVNKAAKKLFKVANTAKTIKVLDPEELEEYIKTIGLFKNKRSNIIATCKILSEAYDGEIPSTRSELEKLPGVGRKTASVILNIVFNQKTIAVDTHVFRTVNRIGIHIEKNKNRINKVEDILLNIIPDKYKKNAHFWLVDHGKNICKARKPNCAECKISKYCDTFNKTSI